MPYETHGLRHDTEALFAKLEGEELWAMTPCVVIDGDHIHMARSAGQLLPFPDHAQVICGWPGAKRQDVFEFTVGQFRAYARDHRGGDQPMTCCDDPRPETKTDDPEAPESSTSDGQPAETSTSAEANAEVAGEAVPAGETPAVTNPGDNTHPPVETVETPA